MSENIWDVLEEGSFEYQNEVNEWNLNETELHPQDIKSWFDIRETRTCVESFRSVLEVDSLKNITNNKNSKNKRAFEDFVKTHLQNPEYADKYAVFIDGHFQKYGVDKIALVKEIYDEFGNTEIYIDKISSSKTTIVIDTPEFV